MSSFVVKVQISQHSFTAGRQILVYNEDKSILWQDDAGKEIVRTLRGRPKAFFNATRDDDGVIHLNEEVGDPGW